MSGSGEKALAAEAKVNDLGQVKATSTTKDEKSPETEPTPPFSNYLVGMIQLLDIHLAC